MSGPVRWKGKEREPARKSGSIDSTITEISDVLLHTLDLYLAEGSASEIVLTDILRANGDVVKSLGYSSEPSYSKYISQDPKDLMPRVTLPGLEVYEGTSMHSAKKTLERDLANLVARLQVSHDDRRFTCFRLLPFCFRLMIWDEALIQEAVDNHVVVDVYLRRIMPTKNLVSKVMNACKESQRQAKEFYVGKRPIYHTDEKSYLRRVLRNEGPSLLEEAGIVHFNVLYNPFIYGPRYSHLTRANGKPYLSYLSLRIYDETPTRQYFSFVHPDNLFGISCIASPGPRVRNQVGRRVYSEGSEVLTGMDMVSMEETPQP